MEKIIYHLDLSRFVSFSIEYMNRWSLAQMWNINNGFKNLIKCLYALVRAHNAETLCKPLQVGQILLNQFFMHLQE